MISHSQEIFNQYRESKIIEIIQAVSRSDVGHLLAFKGGTALRLFWGLPRYSQDIDYTLLPKKKRDEVYKTVLSLAQALGYEITDSMKKFRTILFEFRFKWEGPTFRIKIEISDPLKEDLEEDRLPVRIASMRGVPITILSEGRLTAQKLCAFMERSAPRDVYDVWFILNRVLKIDWAYVLRRLQLSGKKDFFDHAQSKVRAFPVTRLVNDVGQLVDLSERNWLKQTFIQDLTRLLHEASKKMA